MRQFTRWGNLIYKVCGKFRATVLVDIGEFVWKRVQINDSWTLLCYFWSSLASASLWFVIFVYLHLCWALIFTLYSCFTLAVTSLSLGNLWCNIQCLYSALAQEQYFYRIIFACHMLFSKISLVSFIVISS